ncbi:hypothetical protein [Nesterenkonia suensis]
MALVSAGLHLLMIGHGGLLWSAVMMAMALACVPCAVHLWRREGILSWRLIGLMNGFMVLVHLILLGDPAAAGALLDTSQVDGHAVHGGALHGGQEPSHHGGSHPTQTVFIAATVVALVEVLLATWRGWLRGLVRRIRS